MSTTGIVTYRTNRDQIILGALRLVGGMDIENVAGVTTNQYNNAAEALNLMVKGWEAEGLQLWERKYGVIFPQKSQSFYVLGSPGPAGDHATMSTPLTTGYNRTTLSASAASGASTVTLTAVTVAATGGTAARTIAGADRIGIQLDDGTMNWDTVLSINTGTKVVTLTGTLGGAATSGNTVVAYTTKLTRPLRVLDGWIRKSAGNDMPCRIISREEYNRYGMKSSAGPTVQLYYDPQENTGHLYMYPVPSDVTDMIFIEFQRAIDDFTASTDDYDLPQEWGEAIKWGLAFRLAPEYDVVKSKFDQIKEMSLAFFSRLDSWDQEVASVYIQPDTTMFMHNVQGF